MQLTSYSFNFKKLTSAALTIFMLLSGNAWSAEVFQNLSLNQAIEIALKNNIEKQISYQSALIAESQYQQALSARWPTLTLQAGFQHRDQAPTFTNPAMNVSLPQQLSAGLYQMSGGAIKCNLYYCSRTNH